LRHIDYSLRKKNKLGGSNASLTMALAEFTEPSTRKSVPIAARGAAIGVA
jgi:hypothetical protein